MNKKIIQKPISIKKYADDNIKWYSWSKDVLNIALIENKPIFLLVGSYHSQLTKKMLNESFSDQQVITLLNEHYLTILVDKDERPDVSMAHLQISKNVLDKEPWPLSVILDSEQNPLFIGTYLSKENLLSTLQLTKNKWTTEPAQLIKITDSSYPYSKDIYYNNMKWDNKLFDLTFDSIREFYDEKHGEFLSGSEVFFPHYLIYLLYYYKATNNKVALNMGVNTLTNIYNTPMYDLKGQSFWNYSTSKDWHNPSYKKTLIDNALVGITYLLYYWETRNDNFKAIAINIIKFLEENLLSNYDIFYPYISNENTNLEHEVYRHQHNCLLTSNTIMIWLYTNGFTVLGKQEYLHKAVSLLHTIIDLFNSNKQAFLWTIDSYAFLVHAIIEVYYVNFQEKYLQLAIELSDEMIKLFYNEQDGNFFYTPDTKDLKMRPQVMTDLKFISGNSIALYNINRLKDLTNDFGYKRIINQSIQSLLPIIYQSPSSYPFLQLTQLISQNISLDIVVICDDVNRVNIIKDIIYQKFNPFVIVNFLTTTQIISSKFFSDYEIDQNFALYVCEKNTCLDPIEDFDEAILLLKELFS